MPRSSAGHIPTESTVRLRSAAQVLHKLDILPFWAILRAKWRFEERHRTVMKINLLKKFVLLSVVAAILSLGLTACRCCHKRTGSSEHPAKSEQPAKSEHPEHPK
jgi:hypothetical protein